MALTRRPSDEREYDEPLAALTESAGREPVRPDVRAGGRRAGRWLPGVAAVALAIVLGAGVIGSLALRNAGPAGPSPIDTRAQSGPLVGCWGQAPGFSPDLLAGTGTAEAGGSPAAAVLRAFVETSLNGVVYPRQGWHLVWQTSDEVQFITRLGSDPMSEYQQVVVKRGGTGEFATDGWSLSSYGYCVLRTIPPVGYGSATWTLDPSAPLTPGLHILVSEAACHGTEPTAADRIRADVRYEEDAIVVTVTVKLPEGAQECPLPPPTPYTVPLTEPVGGRAIIDGSPWPHVTVVAADPGLVLPTPAPSAEVTSGPTSTFGAERTFLLYRVKHGDTMSGIAAKFGISLEQLVAANVHVIPDPSHIEVGQVIYIPWASWVPPTPGT